MNEEDNRGDGIMNKKIRDHVKKYNEKTGYGTEDKDIIEAITEQDIIYEEVICNRRHWNDTFRVCRVDGLLIGYEFADTTGDMGTYDVGWEFDPDSICEVIAEEITKTTYKPKEEKK